MSMSLFSLTAALPLPTLPTTLAVVPILIGPLQTLLAILPGLLLAMLGGILALFKPRTTLLFFKLLWRQKWPVLAIVAVVAGGAWAWTEVGGGVSGRATLAEGEYPAFRGGPERRAWVPGAPDPTAPALHWGHTANGKTMYSSPAVAGGYVFAVGSELSPFSVSGKGTIYCLDAETGETVWTDRVPGVRATFSSPAVDDGYLVVGEGLHFTNDSRVICLDAGTGRTVWTYSTSSHVESSPAIADGRVFVGAGADGIYAFALEPGPDGEAQVLWHAPGEVYADAESSPVVVGEKMVMGLGFGAEAVIALDAATGEEHWKITTPYPVFSSPTAYEGRVYAGMGNANFVFGAEQLWEKRKIELREEGKSDAEIAAEADQWEPGGAVWCIDPEAGEVLWKFPTPDAVLGSVVVDGEHIFFGSRDGILYKLDMEGKLVREWNTGAPLLASPSLADRHLYAVSQSGVLFGFTKDALSPVVQARLWETPPEPLDFFLSSPTVAYGRVYVGTPGDGLRAVGKPGTPAPPVWRGPRGGLGSGGVTDAVSMPERLTVQSEFHYNGAEAVAAPAIVAGHAYVPLVEEGRHRIAAIELSGTVAEAWSHAAEGEILGSPVFDGERLHWVEATPDAKYLVSSRPEPDARRVITPLGTAATGELLLAEGHVAARLGPSEWSIHALTADGPAAKAWELTEGGPVPGVHILDQLAAVVTLSPPALKLLDAEMGTELWSTPLEAAPSGTPVISETFVFIPTATGVEARSLLDGELLWQRNTGPLAQPLIVEEEVVLAHGADGRAHLLDAATGDEIAVTNGGTVPLMLGSGSLYYLGSRGFSRISLDAPHARAENWLRWRPEPEAELFPPHFTQGRLVLPSSRSLTIATAEEGS